MFAPVKSPESSSNHGWFKKPSPEKPTPKPNKTHLKTNKSHWVGLKKNPGFFQPCFQSVFIFFIFKHL